MSEERKVIKAAGLVGALTLLSRVSGLVRGAVLTAMFGDSRLHDIFLTAFEVVNLPRRMLGEGALSSFIVPLLTERREQGGAASGWTFLSRAANLMALISLALTLICIFFSKEAFLIFGGYGLQARGETAFIPMGAHLVALMSPFILGLTLASVLMGACHTLRVFGPPSLGSLMLNLALIPAGLWALVRHPAPERAAVWLAYAVLVGVVLRVAIMMPALWRHGWRWRPDFNFRDRDVQRLLKIMIPGLLAMGISQVNLSIANFFAMYLAPGVKTYIYYSNLLIQFPMGLTATAAATTMLPRLAELHLQSRGEELRGLMALAKRLEIVLMAPAMLGLMVFGLPIVRLVFERGAWNGAASRETALALLFYAPGLLPLGWCRLLEPLFWARHDRVTPLKAAAGALALNVALNYFFAFHTQLNQMGLALAHTAAVTLNYFLLSRYLNRIAPEPFGARPRIGETLAKALGCAVVACGAGWLGYAGLTSLTGMPAHTLMRALLLLPTLAAIAALYFWLVKLWRVPDADRALEALVRKLRRG